MSSAEDTSAIETSAESSAAPTSCKYDNSVGEYIKCNKELFTTTQLVGAGIGVTFLIFGLVFAILWFCRRKRTPSKDKKKDVEKRKKDEESESSDEDEDDEEVEEKKPVRKIDTQPRLGKPATVEDVSDIDMSDAKSVAAPSRPARPAQAGQTLGQGLKPPGKNDMLSAPSSRAPSYAGSPVEPRPIRNLYPSNPDARNTTVGVGPPGRPSRPPSTVWQGQGGKASSSQRPLTGMQRQQSSNTPHQPPVSSGLKPQDPRAGANRSSSYVSQGGERRPSQPPVGRAQSFHPSTNPSGQARTASAPRATSVYSATNKRQSGQEPPLPALPGHGGPRALAQTTVQSQVQAQSRSRSNSVMSTASRATIATRKSTYLPDDPPGYTSSRETSPKMRPQPPIKSVSSHQGISRMSSAASIQLGGEEETFVDAPETIEEEVKPQNKTGRERKQRDLHDSPLPYE